MGSQQSSEGQLYIELMKKVLTDFHRLDQPEYTPARVKKIPWLLRAIPGIKQALARKNYVICKRQTFLHEKRMEGRDWPANADTMVGMKRLENVEHCLKTAIADSVPGDFIETGVWRGGTCIFARAILKALGETDRKVWVADSFAGLPKPDEENYEADAGDKHFTMEELAISMETVQQNFRKYDLLDEQVQFLKGWFKDTLPTAPIESLAVARLDGDMYESTMNGLDNLYPKLSKGGFLIVDDWGAVPACKQAVVDYRTKHGITEEIHEIDWTGVYWRRES